MELHHWRRKFWRFASNWVKMEPFTLGARIKIYMPFNPDGTLKWNYTTEAAIIGSPAIDVDGTLYIISLNCNLYAFNDSAPVVNFMVDRTSGGVL